MTTEPTDAELKAMWQLHAADIGGIFYYARAVLAKWGQPARAPADSVLEDALSDAVRVPLDSLHADAAYLIGRLRGGSMPYARVIEIIRERIDAAKAAIRARAAQGDALDAARWHWLSEHIQVAWDEGKFTSLVRIVSEQHRQSLNASVDRMMAGDWSDAARAAAEIGKSREGDQHGPE